MNLNNIILILLKCGALFVLIQKRDREFIAALPNSSSYRWFINN